MAALSYTAWQMGAGQEEPLGRFVDVESSDSDATSDASDGPSFRRRRSLAFACGAAAGLTALTVLVFSAAVLLGVHVGLRHGSLARGANHEDEFGEKVLIASMPSTPPPTWVAPSTLAAATTVVAATALPSAELATAENLTDGNVCKDDEELLGGLCYRKCSILTDGKEPIRTSPWSCCKSHPCLVNQKLSIHAKVACTGFDVAGDGSCPHRPGACLEDEELFLGVCYKKCSLLTEEAYPHRVAPATCCEGTGLNCLDFRKDYTSNEFAVGGGEDRPGACHADEELLLGKCYKKCSLLTDGEYPLRFAFATCCKAHSKLPHKLGGVWHLGCLDPRNDKSRAAFNVPGDETPKVANADAHFPLKELTEQA